MLALTSLVLSCFFLPCLALTCLDFQNIFFEINNKRSAKSQRQSIGIHIMRQVVVFVVVVVVVVVAAALL